jgi:hypothetical protein
MNFMLVNNKFGKIALISAAILFLLVSAFGLINHMNEMKMMGAKDGCVLSGSNEVCPMNLSEHITLWQDMFTGLPQNYAMLGLLVLAATLFAIFTLWENSLIELCLRLSSRFRFYIKLHPHTNFFNYIKEVFSSGILNTKVYVVVKI